MADAPKFRGVTMKRHETFSDYFTARVAGFTVTVYLPEDERYWRAEAELQRRRGFVLYHVVGPYPSADDALHGLLAITKGAQFAVGKLMATPRKRARRA